MANETETSSTVTGAGSEEAKSTVTESTPPVETSKAAETKVDDKVAAGTAESKAAEAKVAQEKLDKAISGLELKLPEGLDAKHASIAAFKKLAAEHGLDSAKAQKFFDAHRADITAQLADAEKARDEGGREALASMRKEWRASLEKDAEFGGAKFKETRAAVSRVFNKYGATDAELKSFLNDGAGDHPALVKFLARIGRDMAEDTSATKTRGNGATPSPHADLQKFFDKSPELFT